MTTSNPECPSFSLPSSDRSIKEEKSPSLRREKTKRPQLSCNDCRTRKVKCDRLQPCTACSLHQIADSCCYELTEAERHPILQAEAIKLKDKEIARLRQENQMLRAQSMDASRAVESNSVEVRKHGSQDHPKKMAIPVKRPRDESTSSNVYFGSPSTSVAKELSVFSFGSKSGVTDHEVENSTTGVMETTYPFPTLWHAQQGTSCLIDLLPNSKDFSTFLSAFEYHAPLYYFPYLPEACHRKEVQQFLSNIEHNSLLHPDVLAVLFAALAQGVQSGLYDRWCGKWVPGAMQTEIKKGDVFIAAAMHALRTVSLLSRPTLSVVEALLMIGPYLTNAGKYLDAWSLFGITIRLAQAIGLHRDPCLLNPSVSQAEATVRKKLWWWILHMDQQYSLALGRPLGISSTGDCPSPVAEAQVTMVHPLEIYSAQITILARQVLVTGSLSHAQIDDFTSKLLTIHASLPESVRFDQTWLNKDTPIPQWPLDVQAACVYSETHHLIIFLNGQGSGMKHDVNNDTARDIFPTSASTSSVSMLGGREQLLKSCCAVIQVLIYIYVRQRSAMICWTVCQRAFNAAWILLHSMLKIRNSQYVDLVQQAYAVFVEMQSLGIHSLASIAVERLGDLMNKVATGGMAEQPLINSNGMVLYEDSGFQNFVLEMSPISTQVTPISMSGLGASEQKTALGVEMTTYKTEATAFKKQKSCPTKAGTKNKAPNKPSTKRTQTSVHDRQHNGLRMKEDYMRQSGLDNREDPAYRPPYNLESGLQLRISSDIQARLQDAAIRSSENSPTTVISNVYSDGDVFQPPGSGICKSFQDQFGPLWSTHPMQPDQTTLQEDLMKMHRSYSSSHSEYSTDPYSQSQTSTQYSSPIQSQPSAQQHSLVNSSTSSGSPQSTQAPSLPHDMYDSNIFGMTSMQSQAESLALSQTLANAYQTNEVSNYAWQVPSSGLRGEHHHQYVIPTSM